MRIDPEKADGNRSATTSFPIPQTYLNAVPQPVQSLNHEVCAHDTAFFLLSRQATSVRTGLSSDPSHEVDWDGDDDRANPLNWSLVRKGMIICLTSFATFVVVLYSTAYASGIPLMMRDFGISSEPLATLGITTYLLGLALGSVVLAPLSEVYGRRPVYIAGMSIFAILVLPCALATSLTEILIWRFFGALAGSVMIANAPGTVADIVDDEHRALAFSVWSLGPMNGPCTGPIISGFVVQYLGWRWSDWLVMIFAGLALISVIVIDETYSPSILRRKAKLRRQETGNSKWWSRYDQKLDLWPLLKVNLARPLIMSVSEPICIFFELYVATIYGILYLCFIGYPIIFTEVRGWERGISGLAFLGILTGSCAAIFSEPLLRKMINAHPREPSTGRPPPEAAVSVICIGAILAPAGILWFAWTSVPATIHWIWPMLAGIPFGAGNTLVFIYSSSYLAGSYGVYSASALAGNTVARSVVGGTLPLAGAAMYRKLGPNWATTLLGLLEVALIPIPFVFYRYGHRIRTRSKLIKAMQLDMARLSGRATVGGVK